MPGNREKNPPGDSSPGHLRAALDVEHDLQLNSMTIHYLPNACSLQEPITWKLCNAQIHNKGHY